MGWYPLGDWLSGSAAAVDEALRLALTYPYPQASADFRRQVEAIAAFDGRADLARITAPTLVLGGTEDLLYSPADSAALADRIPNARMQLIDGAAHAIHLERPEAFVAVLAEFSVA